MLILSHLIKPFVQHSKARKRISHPWEASAKYFCVSVGKAMFYTSSILLERQSIRIMEMMKILLYCIIEDIELVSV